MRETDTIQQGEHAVILDPQQHKVRVLDVEEYFAKIPENFDTSQLCNSVVGDNLPVFTQLKYRELFDASPTTPDNK